jgi:environmental stress-induced protein Ves
MPRIVRAADIAPVPWRNGGGQTRELLVWPPPQTSGPQSAGTHGRPGKATAAPWRLRISLAEVARSGPFSVYPGVERWFCVVDGAGVRLRLQGREHRLGALSAPLHFPGDAPADCDLVDGPTRDLNLMTAGGAGQMLPAAAGARWESAHAQRGLFTRVAGVWSDDRGRQREMPALTLLWMEEAAGRRWEFHADPAAGDLAASGSPGPDGWWLGYAPDAGGAQQ